MKVELLIFFSIINNPSRSVNNSNSTLHLFNAACNVILVLQGNKQDQDYMFQCPWF